MLNKELNLATEADKNARNDRRQADNELTENNRMLSRSESDRDIALGQLENWKLALSRFEEAALNSKNEIKEANNSITKLDNLEVARSEIEDLRISVETARLTMLTKRSTHDEIRREGENRNKRVIETFKIFYF